jgi:peptide deformylase
MKIVTDINVLRTKCEPVSVSKGLEIGRELIGTLREVNRLYKGKQGIGLAAPQIGIFRTVCVLLLKNRQLTLVNPRIVEHSSVQVSFTEGCLSLPGVQVETKRFLWVVVECDNWRKPELFGTKLGITSDEQLLASVAAQHEIDHLQQTLIYDRK